MKLSGVGRILLWSGGSLWIGRSGEPSDFHSHHAVQISLSFSDEGLCLRCKDGDWPNYKSALVAAHQTHAFKGGGSHVGMIFVEPESREGRVLRQCYGASGIASIAETTIEHEKVALFDAYKSGAPDSELSAAARAVVSNLAAKNTGADLVLDKRIVRAKKAIREHIDGAIQLADIANVACLSPDRFRHLFIEETGIRFRPYVLWLRIEVALASYVASRSLTEAAHAGGFADSAHFSRTFKRMFGIAPSSIQLE